jgi:predicted dehydrogenase
MRGCSGMETLGLGIIGCGGISGAHLPIISSHPRLRLIGLADVREEAAQRRRTEFGGEYATRDVDRLLADSNIEAVCIFATHSTHADLAVRVAQAGKPLFCEKPLGQSVAECRAIQKAVAAARVKNMVGYWFRYHEAVRKVHSLIPEPYLIVARTALAVDPALSAIDRLTRRDPRDRSGFFDHVGYLFDTAGYLIPAPPVTIQATAIGPGARGASQVITVKYANGAVLCAIYSELGDGGFLRKWFFEISGGVINATIDHMTRLTTTGTGQTTPDEYPYTSGRDDEWDRFASYLIDGGNSPLDVWEASIPTVMMEKAVASARVGGPVPVDLYAELEPHPEDLL